MRALTSTDVYVADKLFATLDTTVRRLAAADRAADPRHRHRRLHQEAAARSRRLVPLDARRGRRRRPAAPRRRRRGRRARRAARGDPRGARRDRRRPGPDLARAQQDRSRRRGGRAPRSPSAIPTRSQLSAKAPRGRRRAARAADRALRRASSRRPSSRCRGRTQKVAHLIHERTTVLAEEHGDTGTSFRVKAPARVLDALREALRN